jgi:hypothetical protein
MTATPEENSISDTEGLAAFVEPCQDNWAADRLTAFGLERDVNPYEPPDDHPAAKVLRPTVRALKKFILSDTVGEAAREHVLQHSISHA